MPIRDWIFGLFGRRARAEEGVHRKRGQATHVLFWTAQCRHFHGAAKPMRG